MALFRLIACQSSRAPLLRSATSVQSAIRQLKLQPHIRSKIQRLISQSRQYAIDTSKSPHPSNTKAIPEQLLIYHAGTSRITFLAFWKITTIFTCAFFCLVAAPSYLRSEEKSNLEAAGLAACGLIPFVYVAYTTAPFVTFIYLRLPPSARASTQHLQRFIRAGPPPSTQVQILTMGLASRPRAAIVSLADLKPVNEMFGLVNYSRDVSKLSAIRKWHQYRPVAKFGVRTSNAKGVREAWVWDAIQPLLGKTQRQRAA